MNYWTFLVILFLPWLAPRVQAAPNSLTYQGRILDSKGKGLEYNNVSFLFEILNPVGNCVIYREQKDGVNMVNSNGTFDVPIGSGNKLFPADPVFKLIDSFDNTRIHDCAGGSKYTAKQSDVRILQVQFHDGSGWKVISPSNEIRSVPYAAFSHSANLIGNRSLDDLLLKELIPVCTNDTFLNWNGTKFICSSDLSNNDGTVTSISSLTPALTVANPTSTPTLSLAIGTTANTVAAGNDPRFSDARPPTGTATGDLSGTYPNPSVEKIQGQPLSLTGVSEGQLLTFKSNQWVPSTLQASDITGLSAMFTPYLKTADFNTAVANANCAAHQTMTYTSVAGFTCQSINVGLAGDVTGSIGASKVERLQGKDVSATAPTNNQVLQWNGTAWTPSTLPAGNAGTVTSVSSSTTALSITNSTTTPTLTLAIGTAANTVAAGNDARFSDSRTPTGAASGDLSGTYPNPSVNKIQGQNLSLSGVTEGQLLTYKSNQWVPSTLQASDVAGLSAMFAPYFKTADFNTAVANANCAAHQTMTYTSVAGFTCQSINVGLAGDVTGGIGASKVERLQGKDVSATAPTNNQVLQWNGTAWTPSTLPAGNPGTVTSVTSSTTALSIANGTSTPTLTLAIGTAANTVAAGNDARFTDSRIPKGAAGGDLSGNYPNPSVDKIQGQVLALNSVTEGQLLTYKSNQWVPSTLQASDVTGLSALFTPYLKTADFNTAVANANCAAHQTMTYTSVAGFTCQSINVSLAGDVTGSIGVSKVERLQGKNISATAPTNNQVLQWNGTAWTPSTLPAGNPGTVTSVSSSTTALSIANGTTTPTLTLAIGTSANTVAAGNDARFSDSRTPTGGASGDLSGTYPSPSVNKIQGRSVAATAPSNNQVLQWNGTAWTPSTLPPGNAGTVTSVSSSTPALIVLNGSTAPTLSLDIGTTTNTVAAGDDARFTDSRNPKGTAGGDLSGTYPSPSVAKIQGRSVAATAPLANQFLQWSGVAWTPVDLPAGNPGTVTNVSATLPIRVTTPTSTPQISVDAASASAKGVVQIGTGLSVDGNGLISVNPTTFSSAVPVNKGGTGATSLTGDRLMVSNAAGSAIIPFSCPLGQMVSFDATGKMICDGSVFKNGGNSFGALASIGTNDAFDLNIKTSNATRMTISSAGNFAINSAVDDANAKLIIKASTTTQNPLSLDTVASGSSAIDFLRNGSWLGALGYTDSASNDFYVSNGKANALVFETQSKERMRLANSGFLGINEGTPLAPLHIGSFGIAGSKYSSIQLGSESTVASNYYIANEVEGGKRFFRIKNGTASSNQPVLSISELGHLSVGESGSGAGVLLLKPGTANHTYISFFARTATPNVRNAYIGFPNNGVNDLNVFNETAGGNLNFGTYLGTVARNVLTLTPDGNAQLLGAYQNYSDKKLKRDIQSLDHSLDDILNLKPSSYFWKDSSRGESKQYGFIAQDLEEVFPEIVTTNEKTGIKTVSYMQLIAPLAKAIQEMYHQFHALFKNHDSRLEKLEEEMELLKTQNRLLMEQNQKLLEKIDSKDP